MSQADLWVALDQWERGEARRPTGIVREREEASRSSKEEGEDGKNPGGRGGGVPGARQPREGAERPMLSSLCFSQRPTAHPTALSR